MLSFFRASSEWLESGRMPAESCCCATPGRTKHTRPNVKTSDVAAATVLIPAIGRYPLVYVYGGRELFPHNMPFWHSAVVTHVTCPGTGLPHMAVPSGGARAVFRHGPAGLRHSRVPLRRPRARPPNPRSPSAACVGPTALPPC